VNISARRNSIAADSTFLYYSTGGGFTQIPSNISRGASCIGYTSITVSAGTVLSLIQRNENVGVYVPAVASTSSCPTSLATEECQNQFTINSNITIYLYVDAANTSYGC
jgi:hypothetical protein